ncbi:MAG: hypothetical protein Q4G35_09160 [Propionibacteriaceae bacterium]|nr:hypothetical protein [Propionibacteriaceae bacterium]
MLVDYVNSQFNGIGADAGGSKSGIIVLPIKGQVSYFTVHSVIFKDGGSKNTIWKPDMPKTYEALTTDTFNGAIPIVVKSDNSKGAYTVTYSIDAGPQQTFTLNWRTDEPDPSPSPQSGSSAQQDVPVEVEAPVESVAAQPEESA